MSANAGFRSRDSKGNYRLSRRAEKIAVCHSRRLRERTFLQRNTGAISTYQTPSGVTFFSFRSPKISAHLSAYRTIQPHLRSRFRDVNDSGVFCFFFLHPIQIQERERAWTNRRVHLFILPDSGDIGVAVAGTSSRLG